MKVCDVLREECIVVGLKFSDNEAILREISSLARKGPILRDLTNEEILAGFREYEIPDQAAKHSSVTILLCPLSRTRDFVMGLVSTFFNKKSEITEENCRQLIIFIVGPEIHANEYNQLLSRVSKAVIIPRAVEEMLTETTHRGLRDSFLRRIHDNTYLRPWILKCFMALAFVYIFYWTGALSFLQSVLTPDFLK